LATSAIRKSSPASRFSSYCPGALVVAGLTALFISVFSDTASTRRLLMPMAFMLSSSFSKRARSPTPLAAPR